VDRSRARPSGVEFAPLNQVGVKVSDLDRILPNSAGWTVQSDLCKDPDRKQKNRKIKMPMVSFERRTTYMAVGENTTFVYHLIPNRESRRTPATHPQPAS